MKFLTVEWYFAQSRAHLPNQFEEYHKNTLKNEYILLPVVFPLECVNKFKMFMAGNRTDHYDG